MTTPVTGQRWALILAGGEGSRLKPLTRKLCGDERPKQFCRLLGQETLIEATRRRLPPDIAGCRVLFSLSEPHREFFEAEQGIEPCQRLVQPENKGTAPPIAHALLGIQAMDPGATVAILPCDHYYSDDAAFTRILDLALAMAEKHPAQVVLLGAPASSPEVQYGWIETAVPDEVTNTCAVKGFVEKPSLERAKELWRQGSLWNTFVMAGKVSAFLGMMETALPGLAKLLNGVRFSIGAETKINAELYRPLEELNFSHDVLARAVGRLLVMPLTGIAWSDLGEPLRAEAAAREAGTLWRAAAGA